MCGAAAWGQVAQPPQDDCGFPLESVEAIRKVYGPELQILDLQAGDVIADIGAGSGVRMLMFAMLQDSMEVYMEDIDSTCLNPSQFESWRAWYAQMQGHPFHCDFHLVIGTETETNLPEHHFDKLFVTVSFHHFSAPEQMLQDLKRKLKPDGRIFLIENVVRKSGHRRRRLCDDPLKTESDLRALFTAQGFVVEDVHSLGRWWTKMFVLREP